MKEGNQGDAYFRFRSGEPADDGERGLVWKKPDGTEEIYFYGLGGQKLGAYRFVGSALAVVTTNLYFSAKTIRAQGQTVVTDRLGSVRYAGGTTSRYFPYGQEQVVTGQDREKFGTYYRDGTTGLDYADQRYYGNTAGRFLTADPHEASGKPADPGSWNRYSYVKGDPINSSDPTGLEQELAWCPYYDRVMPINQCVNPFPTDPPSDPQFDYAAAVIGKPITNKSQAKNLFDAATVHLNPECRKVLNEKLGNDWMNRFGSAVKNDEVHFYDARPSGDGNLRASDIFEGASDKTLAEITRYDNAQVLGNKDGAISSDIVFGAAFFSALDLKRQERTLIHELIHAVLKKTDEDLGVLFGVNGSVGFQQFLNNDCKK